MMIKRFYILLLLLPVQTFAQGLKAVNLQCEYKQNPQGIETAAPRLNWQLQSNGHNVLQTAYRILVADDEEKLKRDLGNVWDSKKVNSSASLQVVYRGIKLRAAKTYC